LADQKMLKYGINRDSYIQELKRSAIHNRFYIQKTRVSKETKPERTQSISDFKTYALTNKLSRYSV
jgi:hypothetical protein